MIERLLNYKFNENNRICRLFEVDNGYARASELYMFVVIGLNARNSVEILSQILTQSACTCSMQYPYFTGVEAYRVINVVGECLDGFVDTHSSHIDLLFEVELTRALAVGCRSAYNRGVGLGSRLSLSKGAFQSVGLNSCLYRTECYSGVFAFDFKYFSHGALSVELHVVAHGYGAVIGIAVGLDLLLFALRRFFQQRMFVAVIVEQMLFGLLKLLSRFEGFLFVGLRALYVMDCPLD